MKRRCVYCLCELEAEEITDDHIIAGSWFPKSTGSNIERWTAPACRGCNNRFSSTEQYALLRLATCVDPRHPAAIGIWEKAKRSIEPQFAINERDRYHRGKQREVLFREIQKIEIVPNNTLPFSTVNYRMGSRTALKVNATKLNSVISKWARGFYFRIHGEPLSKLGSISVMHVTDEGAVAVFAEIWRFGKILDGGDGVRVVYWAAEEAHRREDLFAFLIWGQIRFYSGVSDVTKVAAA